MKKSYDYVVIGAGSVGSQILRHLAMLSDGPVLALEQFTPAYSRTAVGGDTRLFRRAYSEGLEYQPILNEALAQWVSLNQLTGRSIYERTGCLYIGSAQSAYMTRLRENAAAAGVECHAIDHRQVRALYPQHRLQATSPEIWSPRPPRYRPNWCRRPGEGTPVPPFGVRFGFRQSRGKTGHSGYQPAYENGQDAKSEARYALWLSSERLGEFSERAYEFVRPL
jgi:choline dehydrogenase-like flavoprotein